MALFGFASYECTAGGHCISKNRDSSRVMKNLYFSTKWIGQKKRRCRELIKTQSVGAILAFLHGKKANPNRPYDDG
jgi:hypothetical protein